MWVCTVCPGVSLGKLCYKLSVAPCSQIFWGSLYCHCCVLQTEPKRLTGRLGRPSEVHTEAEVSSVSLGQTCNMSLVRKLVFGVSDQVSHKAGFTVTEDG